MLVRMRVRVRVRRAGAGERVRVRVQVRAPVQVRVRAHVVEMGWVGVGLEAHLVIPHSAPIPDATRAAGVVPNAAGSPMEEEMWGDHKGAHGDHVVPLASQSLLY